MDFDGTLSEIAQTPQAAVIHPQSADALLALTPLYPLVAVVSGRAARDVRDKIGVDGVVCVGSHGAERIDGSGTMMTTAPSLQTAVEDIRTLVEHLRAVVCAPGILFEDKGFSASVHFRRVADPDDVTKRLLCALADAPGAETLETFWGRMILEIRPANGPNKGDALAELAADRALDAIVFVGDDTTDADGMRRLRRLPSGIATLAIAVVSAETPAELLREADYRVESVGDVGEMLGLMADFRREAMGEFA